MAKKKVNLILLTNFRNDFGGIRTSFRKEASRNDDMILVQDDISRRIILFSDWEGISIKGKNALKKSADLVVRMPDGIDGEYQEV
jgi:hypothetical protein